MKLGIDLYWTLFKKFSTMYMGLVILFIVLSWTWEAATTQPVLFVIFVSVLLVLAGSQVQHDNQVYPLATRKTDDTGEDNSKSESYTK